MDNAGYGIGIVVLGIILLLSNSMLQGAGLVFGISLILLGLIVAILSAVFSEDGRERRKKILYNKSNACITPKRCGITFKGFCNICESRIANIKSTYEPRCSCEFGFVDSMCPKCRG